MKKLAIDIGYGDVKVAYKDKDNNLKLFKYPTAIKRAKISATQFGEEKNTYTFEGKKYIIENKWTGDEIPTKSFEFLRKFAPLFLFHTIKLLKINPKDIEVYTGLSIFNWEHAEEFANRLAKVIVDDEVYNFNINLMAQGQGVFIDAIKNLNINPDGRITVVDIGFNTTDVLIFDDGTPNKILSYAEEFGVSKPINELINYISKNYNFTISEQGAKEIFVKNKIQMYGEEKDLSLVCNELKEDFTQLLIERLRNKIKDILRESNYVIFSGGGAYYINQENLPNNVIFSPTPYEFANVRGYYEKEY